MSERHSPQSTTRRFTLAGMLLLSLLGAIDTLRPDLLPNLFSQAIPPYQKQALTFALFALVSTAIALLRSAPWPRGPLLLRTVFSAIGLFLLPAALIAFSQGSVPALARAALLALVPVFALVFEPYLGHSPETRSPETRSRGAMIAALLALVGCLCIFPVAIPSSIQAAAGFATIVLAAASIAAANCQAIGTALAAPGSSTAPVAAIAGMTAAAGFAAASLALEQPNWPWKPPGMEVLWELIWSAAIQVPALLLLFWLMRRLSAARMATRYICAPMIAILIDALLTAPVMESRIWLGLALMALGAG